MANEMIDYDKIQFKSGIEIHQQLDTGKLFCKCPGYLRSDEPNFTVSRRLHAVAGETGEVDSAVAFEASLGKEFVYQGYNDSNCLIELDEEPPKMINQEALDEALKIALLMNCEIYPASQIMRKTVIDGSNTSGFQRTVLIAHNGFIETSFGKVPVESIALEEDSARPIVREEKKVIYRLDRLGIPLVEITTAPAMNKPEQVKEAALKIGEILRACKVKRGIGTIRQDINMSIKGHNRIEIKGFQDPAMMVTTINNEILRQKELDEIYTQINSRKDKISEYKEVSKIFSNTYCSIIKKAIDSNGKILALKIKGFKGILGKEIQPGKRFGTELAYRARMHGVGGIIHSDENMEKYNISEIEIESLKKELSLKEGDAFIIIASEENKAEKSMKSIINRLNEQFDHPVPAEVRGALMEGVTEFLRPLPGRARMYPETDLPLLRIGRDKINSLKKNLPKLKNEIKNELKKKGLSDELINLVLDEGVDEFNILIKVYPKDANLVAKMVTLWRNEFASKMKKTFEEIKEILTERVLEEILELFINGKIKEGDIKRILFDIANGKKIDDTLQNDSLNDDKLEEEISKIIKEKPGLKANAYMGLVISKLGTTIDKRKSMEILNRLTKNE